MKRRLPLFLLLFAILFTFGAKAQSGLPNKTTKSGFYFGTLLGPGSVGHREANGVTESGLGVGFNLGNKFYFGDDSKSFRLGMDLNWLGIHYFSPSAYRQSFLNFSFVNPGIGVATALGEDLGLDAAFNVGPNVMVGYGDWDEDAAFGMRLGPHVKFHYHILAIGFEYRYTWATTQASDIEGYRNNFYGFTLGLKF